MSNRKATKRPSKFQAIINPDTELCRHHHTRRATAHGTVRLGMTIYPLRSNILNTLPFLTRLTTHTREQQHPCTMTEPTPASPAPENVPPVNVKTEPTSPASAASRKGKGGRRAANPHLSEEERRRERILKNRESAMKSLQKKKRYTEDLEHRAVALASRNAELKDKIRAQLARLHAMGIVAVPGVGVFGGPTPFQRTHVTPFPGDDWLPDFGTPATACSPATASVPQQEGEPFHFNAPVPGPAQPVSQGDTFVLEGDGRQPFDIQHMTCTQ